MRWVKHLANIKNDSEGSSYDVYRDKKVQEVWIKLLNDRQYQVHCNSGVVFSATSSQTYTSDTMPKLPFNTEWHYPLEKITLPESYRPSDGLLWFGGDVIESYTSKSLMFDVNNEFIMPEGDVVINGIWINPINVQVGCRVVGDTLELDGIRRTNEYLPYLFSPYGHESIYPVDRNAIKKIVICSYPDSSEKIQLPNDCTRMFCNYRNLEDIENIEKLDASNTTVFDYMFFDTKNLHIDIDMDKINAFNARSLLSTFSGSGITNFSMTVPSEVNFTDTFSGAMDLDTITIYGSGLVKLDFNSCSAKVIDMSEADIRLYEYSYNVFSYCLDLEHIYTNEAFERSIQEKLSYGIILFQDCFKLHNYNSIYPDKRFALIDDGTNGGYFELKTS